jgi:hypothetical protein
VEKDIEKIFQEFGVTVSKNYNSYVGTCPVHLGDNKSAFNYRLPCDGFKTATWQCYTRSCHETFLKTTIGLIRALLSSRNLRWSMPGNKTVSFFDAVEWLEKRYNTSNTGVVTHTIQEEIKFEIPTPKILLTKQQIRGKLNIPSKYFVNRGFSPKLLDFHDVGPLIKPEDTGLYYRELVPVYDIEGKFCIGATARSVFEACPKCQSYHDSKRNCPKPELLHVYCKWKNWQFRKAFSLYNFWWAKTSLQRTKKAILVEGCGDTWSLKRVGIENVVSPYGRSLSIGQAKLLQNIGVTDLYICFDSDLAGKEGFKQLGKRYWQDFFIHGINIPSEFHDIGEIKPEILHSIIEREYGSK